jgi:hypothetical protein
MKNCDTDLLSLYLDGDVTPDERARVEAHLDACPGCRDVLADLAVVRETAGDLTSVDRVPDVDLWSGVAARTTLAPKRGISLSWVQAIAAGLVLAAMSGGAVWMSMRERPAMAGDAPRVAERGPAPGDEAGPIPVAHFADEAYETAVKDLREALENGRNRLDPQTIQVLERNLASIDQAIAEARKALMADPANVSLNNYLAGVQRRKLDLLRTAGELAQS